CLLGALAFVFSCDAELCRTPQNLRCEGDVLAYCPGGWGNIDFTVDRTDCRTEGKRCVQVDINGERQPMCMEPYGACDPNAFHGECRRYNPETETGKLLECIAGQQFATGPSCTVPATLD